MREKGEERERCVAFSRLKMGKWVGGFRFGSQKTGSAAVKSVMAAPVAS